MGLFGSSDDNDNEPTRANELVEKAHHDSVTVDRLTKLDTSSMLGRGFELKDKPILEYLNEEEQPHFIFFGMKKGVEVEGSSFNFPNAENVAGNATTGLVLCFTTQRVLIILSEEPGMGEAESDDKSYSFGYDEIVGFETSKGNMKHRISLNLDSEAFLREVQKYESDVSGIKEEPIRANFYISNSYDNEEIDSIREYLRENIKQKPVDNETTSTTSQTKSNTETGATISSNQSLRAELGDDARYLDDDEEIQFILEGKSVEIEGGVDKETTSSSIGSRMKTVVTDDRVLLVIPQKLKGTDTKTIIYDDIAGVDLKSGFVVKKLNIQSHTRTYDIHILDEDKAEEVVDYIRKKKKEANRATQQPQAGSSEPDPTEQLKNIKELHDQGVLSDEEFEEKKAELMDRI